MEKNELKELLIEIGELKDKTPEELNLPELVEHVKNVWQRRAYYMTRKDIEDMGILQGRFGDHETMRLIDLFHDIINIGDKANREQIEGWSYRAYQLKEKFSYRGIIISRR